MTINFDSIIHSDDKLILKVIIVKLCLFRNLVDQEFVIMTERIKVESGLSFLSRLTTRPSIDTCLGPGLGPLSQFYTRVLVTGDTCLDSVGVINRYVTDVICRTIAQLPDRDQFEELGDVDGAGVVLVDCCHHISVESIAAELQRKLQVMASEHWRLMKEAGIKREEREKRRITSSKQWEIVKNALSRLYIMKIYNPDNLELSLLSLNDLLLENTTISSIIIVGVNSFYHQVKDNDGVGYNSYIRRLKQLVKDGCGDISEHVKVLAVELNIFGENNNEEIDESKKDIIVIKSNNNDKEEFYVVNFSGNSVKFKFDPKANITWI